MTPTLTPAGTHGSPVSAASRPASLVTTPAGRFLVRGPVPASAWLAVGRVVTEVAQ